ncbi:MAG: CbiX/SirB N-terminal domain-containing protein, partial [Cyanobacteria bacterium J06639_1]
MTAAAPVSSDPIVIAIWHGSRDPLAAAGFEQFVRACRSRLAPISVWGGQLECAESSLAEQLSQLVEVRMATEHLAESPSAKRHAIALPVFMGAGVHVSEDIPAAIAAVCQQYPAFEIQTLPPLGRAPELADVLSDRCMAHPDVEAWIVWGHGSRLPAMAKGLVRTRQQLAARLPNRPVDLAFWSQSPNWQDAVEALVHQGYERVGIVPCFWFAGGLVERLHAEVRAWQSRHEGREVTISEVLTPHSLWVEAV